MQWTGLNDLRSSFLKFFESKGCTLLPSASLIPQDEASLLLINSGMAPLKKYFTRQKYLPNGSFRATSCQKCIRTPDIENVGKTARHGTYFEMLGNFSFGDYFKEEATAWAWEYLTEVLQIPKDLLYVSVFHEDDEAYDIWTQRRGVPESHMVRFGREDNFWEIGSGPCGPCSEIYFDRGPEKGCGKPDCKVGCDCDRFIEIWNLVFTQFNSDGNGNYEPLEYKNIDTGMGLERLACVMQGVDNLFEVDTVQNIMKHICTIAGKNYKDDPIEDISIRVVTDHIRSTTFMVGDGVVPSNEGRGYVLRRLLRRAARHGRLLGITEPFLYKVAETVIGENESAYPELVTNKAYIVKMIRAEEERFAKTIDAGLEQVNELLDSLTAAGKTVFPGDEAFKLYDTFGFPIDLTRELCEERGLTVDEETYKQLMTEQRETAREATRAALGDVAWTEDVLSGVDGGKTFVGYETLKAEGTVLAIVKDGALVEEIAEGDMAEIVLCSTPFYAESGGQVGDTGRLTVGESEFEVLDCKKSSLGHWMHIGRVVKGVVRCGDTVNAEVDAARRSAIKRNHTSAHLLQAALREVLGDHVRQAGSYVDENYMRFDFTHFEAVKPEELRAVEALVNEKILAGIPVDTRVMSMADAQQMGAMALFGEKYGDTVRVVCVDDFSKEFCGGTHAENTAQLGLYRIVGESSVAAGVRRIESVTGTGVLRLLDEQKALLEQTASVLKVGSVKELPGKAASNVANIKALENEIAKMREKEAAGALKDIAKTGETVGEFTFFAANVGAVQAEELRRMACSLRDENEGAVVLLAAVDGAKATLCAACSKKAIAAGVKAGALVRAAATAMGGSGGGKDDIAMAGGKQPEKVNDAFAAAKAVVEAV